MSPYIVTASRPRPKHLIPETILMAFDVTFRRAVATLEAELPRIMLEHGANGDWATSAVLNLRESGGSVGPLPDGTVIEIAQCKRSELYRELPIIVRARFGSWANTTDEQVCSAWNTNYARKAGHGR